MTQVQEIVQNRRDTYETPSIEDAFIVNLLRNKIDNLINTYAIPVSPGSKVLDVGCGNQPFRDRLESLSYTYFGFDINQNIENTVDYLGALDQPLPANLLNSAPFNLILCTEVMEHVADWETSFKNFARLMVPGGKLLITCPHFFRLHEEPHDFWRPTPYALEYFASRAGFRPLYQENAGDAWDVLGTLLTACWTFPASNRLQDRIITKLTSLTRQWLVELLHKKWLQKRVQLKGPLYLSNIAIFEQP